MGEGTPVAKRRPSGAPTADVCMLVDGRIDGVFGLGKLRPIKILLECGGRASG